MSGKEVFSSGQNRNIKERNVRRAVTGLLITIFAAIVSSLALHVFVYPSDFVPLGLEAIVTMLQKITGINAGWFNLILNLPLVIYAWFKLNKKYVVYSLIFTLVSSVLIIVWAAVDFPQYVTENERLLAAIFAGIMLGIRTGVMLRIGSSTGGADVIAAMIQKKMQYVNVERIISVICLVIIAASYFVYRDFNSVLLAVVQMFISERAINTIMRDTRHAIEVKIVTKHPDAIREDIIRTLRHGATLIESKGMYTGEDNSIIISVLNVGQLSELFNVLKKYPDTFVYYTEAHGVRGNFRWLKDEEVK